MIKVFNKSTNELLGRISDAELEFLSAQLEEESVEDTDYYIRKETIDGFEKDGASAHLIEVLRGGMRHDDAIEIRWQRE